MTIPEADVKNIEVMLKLDGINAIIHKYFGNCDYDKTAPASEWSGVAVIRSGIVVSPCVHHLKEYIRYKWKPV